MDKKLTPEPFELGAELAEARKFLPVKYFRILLGFLEGYRNAVMSFTETLPTLKNFIKQLVVLSKEPCSFDLYHQKVRSPFDYYQFGLDFVRPLVDKARSSVHDLDQFSTLGQKLLAKENVVFFANHQTETDPQAISLMLEETHPKLAESIIYVAGERVITDPLAVPFSLGVDLLCIYSKRYIDHPPEKKAEKQMHNAKTMQRMGDLLAEGGKAIYVAPSGGRDRKNSRGQIVVAPFDPNSVEMFYLMSKKSKRPTHFVPMSMKTYDLLPPPATVQKELGEMRQVQRSAIHLAIDKPFDMESIHDDDKIKKRKKRADAIWQIVRKNYIMFP
ncbi:MAG: hypothetical protein RL235_189 [Chlamydiota bacterium]|jgi:glycerol-3-phosphate O-acyltransferase